MKVIRQNQSGFTIIELVATLILMGILVGVSSSMFINQTPYKIRMAVDQTVALLRNARSYAQAINCPVQVSQSGQVLNLSVAANCNLNWGISLYQQYCDTSCQPFAVINQFSSSYGVSYGADLMTTVTVPSGITLITSGLPFFFTPGNQAKASGAIVNPQISIGGNTISVVGQTGFINE